jgi:acyl-coenzyme A synthetase/AMP-(fatty) acid ligase
VPNVARVVAAARDFGNGDLRLVAFLLPTLPTDPDGRQAAALIAAAERHARGELPRHLRPSRYVVLSKLPMTLHGKVNRDALVM